MKDFRKYIKKAKEIMYDGKDTKGFKNAIDLAVFMYDWDCTCEELRGRRVEDE